MAVGIAVVHCVCSDAAALNTGLAEACAVLRDCGVWASRTRQRASAGVQLPVGLEANS